MNVLVTGGAGYIGSHFSKLARKQGWTPVVLDDLSTGHEKFTKFGPFVNGSINDPACVKDVLQKFDIEIVFHFAGKALVRESMEKPDLYFYVNREGTQKLVDAMGAVGVKKLIFSSSCATYGIHSDPIKENADQKPINPYGQSKLEAEQIILKAQKKYRMQIGILRYFNVVGCDPEGELWEDHDPETHIVPNMIKAFKHNKELPILGKKHSTPDGTCIRDYVDVNDLVKVHLALVNQLGDQPFISNVGLGKGLSILEVLQEFEKIFGRVKTQEREAHPGDPPQLVCDNRFFRSWYKEEMLDLQSSLKNLKRLSS